MRKQDWIASQLRRVYDEALQEDIPADMLALLEQLDETPERSTPRTRTPERRREPSFAADLVAAIPMLRGFARSLSGNRDRADDLVQETLAKAIANRDKYRQGTNLHAWLVTILRNQYYSEGRRRWREVSDAEGTHAARLTEAPEHDSRMEMREFLGALQMLPPDQREALVLVGASGLSYEEAAEVLGTRIGTVKSRVSRARARLEALLDGGEGFARDDEAVTKSVAQLRRAMSG